MGADFVFGSHTITGGASAILDLHSASTLFYPVSAGCSSATTGSICYDTTNKNTHIWTNGADSLAAAEASAITSGYIPKSSSSTIGLLAASALNDGVTTANTLTYTGSGGITASNGSITASGSIAAGSSCTPMGASAHGGVCMGENASTGWTPTSGFTYFRADSGHTIQASVNGVAEAPLVQGPASDTSGHIASFSGTAGALLADSGVSASSGTLTATLYATATKCAAAGTGANPSLVACSAAPAGFFSCATNASTGTCVVSTTAVTANSVIQVQPDSTLGTALSVTCNTTADSGLTAPRVSARSAGTSFTITLGTFTTNPECFSYIIIN